MKNFDLVGTLIMAFKLVGEQPLVDLLQTVYVKNPSAYGFVIAGLHFGLSEGQVAATKSANKIDDEVVSALQSVVQASATKNSVVLL